MPARPFDIVGFDLDGTLIDTSGDLTAAVNVALADARRPMLTAAQVKTMIGGGAKHMLQLGLDATGGCGPGEFRRLYKLMLAAYEADIAVHSRPFSGAIDALDALAADGVQIAIVTNKFEHLADKLLAALDLRDRFACVIGGDTLGPGTAKPSPAPIHAMTARCGGGSAAFVGDSPYDIMAARSAGLPVIAVSFGFSSGPVEGLGADAVIDRYAELRPTLARLSLRR